jgi:hypothetical protein
MKRGRSDMSVDYGGAWKELEKILPTIVKVYQENSANDWIQCAVESIKVKMNEIERKHTHLYYKFSMTYIELNKVGFIRDDDGNVKERQSIFTVDEKMSYKQAQYYYNSLAQKVEYRGKNIIITEFKISEPLPIKEVNK